MNLENFEQNIDKKILARGQNYFRDGRVTDFTELENNVFTALVSGTEVYEIRVELAKSGKIKKHFCDCSYDLGEFCKHEVAVFFAVREKISGESEVFEPQKSRKKTVENDIPKVPPLKKILEKMSAEELRIAILECAGKRRRNIGSWISDKFLIAKISENLIPNCANFLEIIRESVRAKTGQTRNFDYWETGNAVSAADEFFREAEDCVEKNPKKSVEIAKALITFFVPAMTHSDDSNGELGNAVYSAFGIFSRAAKNLNPENRAEIFAYILTESKKEKYAGWSFETDFFQIAADICPREKFDFLKKLLAQKLKNSSEFERDQIIEIYADFLQKTNPDSVEKFLIKNEKSNIGRQKLIEFYFEKTDFDAAEKCAITGLKCADYDNLKIEYLKDLIKISVAKKDEISEKKWRQKMFFVSQNLEKFTEAKHILNKKEFQIFFAKIEKNHADDLILGEIFRAEKMWEKLFLFIKKQNCSWILKHFEADLKKFLPDKIGKLAEIYVPEIYKLVGERFAGGRKNYENAAQLLRRIRKLKCDDLAQKIAENLREKFPKRKLLLEELEKI